jgi:RNA polymerase sigma-70 factor (ECF subfamily)
VNKPDANHPVPDIDKIIVGCQNDERQAQKALYELFAARMFSVCLRYCSNRMEAEDLLHEGFIKVFTKIGQYNNSGPIEAWVRRIMVNTVLEEFRKKKKMNFVGEEKMPPNISDDIDDDENGENEVPEMNQIMELVNELPERYRMVFNLFVIEEYSHDEIAKIMEISVGTSKSNLSRARQWLKNRITNHANKNQESYGRF